MSRIQSLFKLLAKPQKRVFIHKLGPSVLSIKLPDSNIEIILTERTWTTKPAMLPWDTDDNDLQPVKYGLPS